MKTYFTIMAAALLAAGFIGCSESTTETTHRNLDGSVTHEQTTVQQNDITGTTSVDKESTRTR